MSDDARSGAVHEAGKHSLSEMHRTVSLPAATSWIRRLFAFAGPAYLVSVGYMDPGNWATDLAGGARFGYTLLWVLLMSNLMAVLLQTLAARLGVVTGKDLAQACRDYYPRVLVMPLWILCEVAIVACDLAEVLGAAIGLQLLFGLPLLWGVLITAFDVLVLLSLSRLGMRRLELIIFGLVTIIGACFALEMALARPDVIAILRGFIPRDAAGAPTLFARAPGGGIAVLGLHRESLFIAMGILGATVMPHNLYLHSGLVQTRAVEHSIQGKREACHFNLVDSIVALNCAFFVNAAILILASSVFHNSGHRDVASLADAHSLLAPLLGTSLASTLFAIALLSSGQSSTITGTLAGQIVMEGFLRVRIRPWLRRLVSRGLAIVPAALVIGLRGEKAVDELLLLSQVVLSLQLSFAVIPLITFTSDRSKMGEFVNPPWVVGLAVLIAVIIAGLNIKLVTDQVTQWFAVAGSHAPVLWVTLVPVLVITAGLLAYITLAPLLQRLWPALVPAAQPEPALQAIGSRGTGGVPARVAAVPEHVSGYRRIAVALELGAADTTVLEYLRAARISRGTEMLLLHVTESAASRFLGMDTSDVEVREDEATLEFIANEFRSRGLVTHVRLGHGDAAKEIVRLVEELSPDLLVTGGHGHGTLQDILYGSTVSAVRHRVKCPVLSLPTARA